MSIAHSLTSAKFLIINGTRYRVKRVSEKMAHLVGPRGGEATLVRNIYSNEWSLLVGAREKRIVSFEEVQS